MLEVQLFLGSCHKEQADAVRGSTWVVRVLMVSSTALTLETSLWLGAACGCFCSQGLDVHRRQLRMSSTSKDVP